MSIEAINWAWSCNVAPGEKLTLMAIANHADEDGVCWPSQERLATMTGAGARSVRRNLRQLEQLGFIRREKKYGRTDKYVCVLEYTGQSGQIDDDATPAKVAKEAAIVAEAPAKVAKSTGQGGQVTLIEPSRTIIEPLESAKAPKQKRAARIPDNFELTESSKEYAFEKGFTHDRLVEEFEAFGDHWRTSSKNERKHNWQLAWKTWVRNSIRFAAKRKPDGNGKTDYDDRVKIAFESSRDEHERKEAGLPNPRRVVPAYDGF